MAAFICPICSKIVKEGQPNVEMIYPKGSEFICIDCQIDWFLLIVWQPGKQHIITPFWDTFSSGGIH
jgi:hypothetical protein